MESLLFIHPLSQAPGLVLSLEMFEISNRRLEIWTPVYSLPAARAGRAASTLGERLVVEVESDAGFNTWQGDDFERDPVLTFAGIFLVGD